MNLLNWKIIRAVSLVSFTVAAVQGSERPKKPNVVLMLIDDLGWQDLGCYDIDEPTPYESPNIDELAKRGVLFRQAYSPAPTCAPSRCAIMAGKHPARLQKTHILGGQPPTPDNKAGDRLMTPWYSGRLGLEEVTIAEALRANDYRTAHSGKWHMSMQHGSKPEPEEQGFDVSYGGRGANSKMKPHRLTGFATHDPGDPYQLDKDGFPKDSVTLDAISFMEEAKEQPFFLYYATWLVHYPIMTRSKPLLQKYCDKLGVEFPKDPNGWPLKGQRNPYYCAMVEMMDAYVGKLINYLDTTDDPRWPGHKLIENSYVIFTSDNGGCIGGSKETYTDNTPLDKGKTSAKEGGVRVPLIILGPGIKQGADTDVLANGIDFYPTILSWTKTATPTGVVFDGCDLSDLLGSNPLDPARVKMASGEVRTSMMHHYPHGREKQSTLREGGLKLIYNYDHIGLGGSKPEFELFRLYEKGNARGDIEEAMNLVACMPEKVQAMKALLFAELDAMDATRPYLNPHVKAGLPNKGKVCTALKASRDGNMVTLAFKENGSKVIKGYLMVTPNGGEKYEEWFRKEAVLSGNTLTVELPEGCTHYLFNLIDENNFLVSYPELDDVKTARKNNKKYSEYAIQVK